MADHKMARRDSMEELHAAVARKLKSLIESDGCKAADITAALKFLQSNGIVNLNPDELDSLTDAMGEVDPSELPPGFEMPERMQ